MSSGVSSSSLAWEIWARRVTLFINLGINIQLPAHILHHRLLVIRIINGKIGIISQIVNVTSQNPYTC